MWALRLEANQSDDPDFLAFVENLIRGATTVHRPECVLIFKIDNWFDHKWLTFSGKALGAVGRWSSEPTIPPFVANRIIGQQHFAFDFATGEYCASSAKPKIHHQGISQDNWHRHVKRIAPDSALFWYSGNTANTQRGSLMGYVPVDSDIWPWFLAFEKQDACKISRRKSIHEFEVRSFLNAAEASKPRQEMANPDFGLSHEETWRGIQTHEST